MANPQSSLSAEKIAISHRVSRISVSATQAVVMEAAKLRAQGANLVDFAVRCHARVILRGIRAVSDYENELQMALMNRKLDSNIETVFMMSAAAYTYLSSRLVKEVALLGGMVKGLVSPLTERMLGEKYHQHEPGKR